MRSHTTPYLMKSMYADAAAANTTTPAQTSVPGAESSNAATYQAFLTALYAIIQDPFRRVEILEARLASAKRYKWPPSIIADIEARLVAAKRAAASKSQQETAVYEWDTLGKVGLYVGIAAGVVLTGWLAAQTARSLR